DDAAVCAVMRAKQRGKTIGLDQDLGKARILVLEFLCPGLDGHAGQAKTRSAMAEIRALDTQLLETRTDRQRDIGPRLVDALPQGRGAAFGTYQLLARQIGDADPGA